MLSPASLAHASARAIIPLLVSLALPTAALAAAPADTQLLVKFRAGTPGASASQAIAAVGGHDVRTIPDIGVHVVSVPAPAVQAALASLHQDPLIASAETDSPVHVSSTAVTPNDYYYPAEWGAAKLNMPTVWGTTQGSGTVVVAVIDSGLTTSPDLQGNVVPGWNFLTGTSNTTDDFGHGTQAAGVIAAQSNNSIGVTSYCWQCSIMPIEIIDSSGSGSMSNLASAITWATDHGAKVINMSLGGAETSAVQSAVTYAESKGVLLVASAGNSSCNCAQYPAAYSGVLSVGATNSSDQLTSYSNYGSWVQVAAPGSTYTVTTSGAYGGFSGTSAAAPAVAGIAGLLLSADPTASAAAVSSAIETSAVSVGSFVNYGRVDGAAALSALLGTGSGTGTTTAAPANTSGPTITGSAQQGQTLTASTGTWSNSPTGYTYQWSRCDSTGANCAAITGANGTTYPLTASDVGNTIEVAVTASNAGGSASASSFPTAAVTAPPALPTNTAPPTISGTGRTGQTLTASTGTWSNSPTSYGYQWSRCNSTGGNCAAISGATASTYALTSADVGDTIEVTVTAGNTAGYASAGSAPTGVVQASTQTSSFSGSFGAKGGSQSFGVTVGSGTANAALTYKCASNLTLAIKSAGTTIATVTGPSVLTLNQSLAAGTYTYVVSGTGKCSFTLSVSSPTP